MTPCEILNWVLISSEKNWRLQLNVSISMLDSKLQVSISMLDSKLQVSISMLDSKLQVLISKLQVLFKE